tara:strand:- start:1098 stop:1979 length:882 start_codon:yes stop_codon:yes gene_type:complete
MSIDIKLIEKSGVQLFTIMGLLDDFKKSMQIISSIGYKNIELFGPYPFSSDETKKEWSNFKEMFGLKKDDIFDGKNSKEIYKIIKDNDLNVPSLHIDLNTLRYNFSQLLNEVKHFNSRYIVLPALMEPPKTIDGYKKCAEEFNSYGKKLSEIDMKFVYHNHGYEHKIIDNNEGMNVLFDYTNPEYVKFELDVFWMKAAGKNPLEYLKKYPSRFALMHVKDSLEPFVFSKDGETPDQWMEGISFVSDPGDGILPLKEYISEGLKIGIDYFMIEKDLSQDPIKTLETSYDFLKNF